MGATPPRLIRTGGASDLLTYFGLAVLAFLIGRLAVGYRRANPSRRWHPLVLVGLGMIAIGHLSQVVGFDPIATHLTPWMWTGFIILVDGLNCCLAGNSLIVSRRRSFWILLPLSILFWVVFELYNLRMGNWIYIGLPENLLHRTLAYGWAFATILPAIFEAAELYHNVFFRATVLRKPLRLGNRFMVACMVCGIVFMTVPPLFSQPTAGYLFGFVWMGVIFLLDPWNDRLGMRSLLGDLRMGRWHRIQALWWSGVLCGFLWEFWNYWAHAKWIYIFPILQNVKVFEMPVLGYLGFPFFALECFVFCELILGKRYPGFILLEEAPPGVGRREQQP